MEAIKKEVVSHFQHLLQAHVTDHVEISTTQLSSLMSYKCSTETARKLTTPVTATEIKSVLFSMPLNKAPDPDGFTVEFYKAVWPIIGCDLVTAVQSFLIYGFLPKGVNSTIMSLIPKHTNANTMRDFRPIACCILLYKVISKIIATIKNTTTTSDRAKSECFYKMATIA